MPSSMKSMIIDDETLEQLSEELASFHSADLADIFQELN